MKILLLLFLTAFPLHPAQAQAPAASAPDFANGQPAEQVTVSIPHSSRTKDNFSDIALDFLLTKLFEQQKDVKISYDFMESDFSDRTIAFRNFSVAPDKPHLKGRVFLGYLKIGVSEFIEFLKTGDLIISNVDAKNIKADLNAYASSGEKTDVLIASADSLIIKNVSDTENPAGKDKLLFTVQELSLKNAALSRPLNKIKYQIRDASFKNLAIGRGNSAKVTFESATVNGKTVKTADELKKLIEK